MSNDEIRQFVYEDDLDDVKRIWKEVGWVDDEHGAQQLDHFFATGETLLATVNGKPECSVHTVSADMQIHESVISLLFPHLEFIAISGFRLHVYSAESVSVTILQTPGAEFSVD